MSDGLLEIESWAFIQCKTLKSIVIPSTVTIINNSAFEGCESLEEVDLFDGMLDIGSNAFDNCVSLKKIIIPSTVQRIGSHAFYGASLPTICLPDGLERIGAYAFYHSRLTKFKFPPLVTTITEGVLSSQAQRGGSEIVSVELPESITQIEGRSEPYLHYQYSLELSTAFSLAQQQILGSGAFERCRSLRNLALPSDSTVGDKAFDGCVDLLQLFGSEGGIITALKHRFDNLPIHKMIYYHSYNNLTSEQLSLATNLRSGQRRSLRSKLDPTGKQQDCLGMTPLHILACSTVDELSLYQVLIEKYPEGLITEDRFGALPLLYLLWGRKLVWTRDAPGLPCELADEIVELLVESYKSITPNMN